MGGLSNPSPLLKRREVQKKRGGVHHKRNEIRD